MNGSNWKYDGLLIHPVFMMGRTSVDVSEEADKYRDILQSEYEDTYYNLTLKNIDLLTFVDESCSELGKISRGRIQHQSIDRLAE